MVLPEQVLGGVADSRPGGRSSTHVRDSSQGIHGVLLGGVVKQTKLHPLIVGELDCTCKQQHSRSGLHQRFTRFLSERVLKLTNTRSNVRDVKALSDSCQKVQNHLEVIHSDAGRAVNEEADVHRVIAGFT